MPLLKQENQIRFRERRAREMIVYFSGILVTLHIHVYLTIRIFDLYNLIFPPLMIQPSQACVCPRSGWCVEANEKYRPTMEDAHYCNDEFGSHGALYAVFDGHAGDTTAKWSATNFHKLLKSNLKEFRHKAQPKAILAKTFQDVDAQIAKIAASQNPSSGSTAAVAYVEVEVVPAAVDNSTESTSVSPNTSIMGHNFFHHGMLRNKDEKKAHSETIANLYTANVGDTRIVMSCDGRAIRLTQDHTTRVPLERERVERSGGYIARDRVCGVLAVTRALGDQELKQVITARPYTTRTRLRPEMDEFMILACDGIWDVMSDQDAVDLVRDVANTDPKLAASMIVSESLNRRTTDNLTCIVVSLCGPASRTHSDQHSEQSRKRNRAVSIQCFAKTPKPIGDDI